MLVYYFHINTTLLKNEKEGGEILKKKSAVMILLFCVLIVTVSFGATKYPTIMNNLNTALKNIQAWMVTIATPAAAIGVITGVLIKKFSFGDTERMLIGRRLIRSCFVSYGMVVGIDLILKAITSFVTKK